jgi:hypothetical protein
MTSSTPLPECALLLFLVIIGLCAFRAALCSLKDSNIDFGHLLLSKSRSDWFIPLLTLHIHRLTIFFIISVLFLRFINDSYIVQCVIFIIPLLYASFQRDPLSRAFRAHLLDSVFALNRSISLQSVIFADYLTSYSRSLIIFNTMLIYPFAPHLQALISAFFVALPFWVRLRQCLQEIILCYTQHTDNSTHPLKSLLNALKYASNFPVILIAFTADKHPRWWCLATCLNLSVNTIWDLLVDWNISNLSATGYALVLFNLIIRLFWVGRAFFPSFYTNSHIYLILLSSEVLRRAAWFLLRMHCLHSRPTYLPLTPSLKSRPNIL